MTAASPTLYEEIKPDMVAAGLRISETNGKLCDRIELLNTQWRDNCPFFYEFVVSFEEEFLLRNKVNKREYLDREEFQDSIDNEEYRKIGCVVEPLETEREKLEARSIPSPEGKHPTQTECIRQHFRYRAKSAADIKTPKFSAFEYKRSNNHLHFSFRDQNGNPITNMDQEFIDLLEQSLIVHWQAALPVLADARLLRNPSAPRGKFTASVNGIGNRPEHMADFDGHLFLLQYGTADEGNNDNHYEGRRILSGTDNNLLISPMLAAQGVLSAAVNYALWARMQLQLGNEKPANDLFEEAERALNDPRAYNRNLPELLKNMRESDILNSPYSLGPELNAAMANDVEIMWAHDHFIPQVKKEEPPDHHNSLFGNAGLPPTPPTNNRPRGQNPGGNNLN